jgi:hypothetical protein
MRFALSFPNACMNRALVVRTLHSVVQRVYSLHIVVKRSAHGASSWLRHATTTFFQLATPAAPVLALKLMPLPHAAAAATIIASGDRRNAWHFLHVIFFVPGEPYDTAAGYGEGVAHP